MNAIPWALATCICLATAGLVAACTTPLPADAAPADPGPPRSGGGVLVEVRRQGGIAGWNDRLVVRDDGCATVERRSGTVTLDLAPRVVDRLREALEGAEFATLPAEALPADACCDLIEYWVTYRGHTVHTMDPGAPDALRPVLALVDEIIGSVRKT